MKLPPFLIGVLGAAVVAGACTDPIHILAQLPTAVDTVTVYALSGTSPSLPSGLDVYTGQAVAVDGFAAFDVAFDVVSPTQVRILPVRFVVTSPNGVRIVGLQTQPGTFEQLLKAPATGYETDSSIVVTPGQVVVLQTTRAAGGEYCQFAISPYLYAKLSVLSINATTRTIQFQLGQDTNCGFRSFESGLPTS